MAPAGTITVFGTVADGLSLFNRTVVCPRAVPDNDTTPVVLEPPTTVDGFKVTPTIETGERVRVAVLEIEASEAFKVTVVAWVTFRVVIPNVPLMAPWATVTVVGIAALELLLLSKTFRPPEGAGLLILTVPVV